MKTNFSRSLKVDIDHGSLYTDKSDVLASIEGQDALCIILRSCWRTKVYTHSQVHEQLKSVFFFVSLRYHCSFFYILN